MARTFVCDMGEGDSIHEVLLVRDKQVRTNRNGSRYLQVDLDDRSGTINARHWNTSDAEAAAFQPGDFLQIDGKVQLFQGQLQLIIHSFRKVDGDLVDIIDFLPAGETDVEQLEGMLRDLLKKVRNREMQAIVQAYLMDDEFLHGLRRAPAGIRNHHAYLGGLLEHIVQLLLVHDRIADLYPSLNHDLLRVGIFLHDSGKVRELQYDRVFAYSDSGQLVGHIVQGVEMFNEKLALAEEILGFPVPEDLSLQIKHLILSHHGSYEFGSPKLPMTPEAIALHHLDNLDAKVHNFQRRIRDCQDPTQRWTAFDNQLGRRIYKGPAERY